jgi:type I restriction enzyme S subunit
MSKGLTKISEIILEISMGPFGSDIKVDNFVESGVPVLNGANLQKFKLLENEFRYVTADKAKTFRKAIAKRGDIIVTHRGTIGQISYVPEDSKFEEYVISQSQFRVALDKKIVDPAFFVYYFHTIEGQKRLLANKCHVGVPALAQATTNFRLIEIPLPNIQTQHKIASVLSALDSKIELNNRINAELEAMAKTLYDYWFVQFEFPDENGKPYKTSGGKMVWNEELKREIPEGWEMDKISKKVTIGSGFPFNSEDYNKVGTYKVITIKNVQDGFLDTSSVDYVSLLPMKIAEFCILKEGDILMSLTGNVGRMCFVDQNNLLLNQRVGKLIGEKDFVVYSYFFFKRPENQQRLSKIANGSSQANLSPIEAVKDNFAIPSKKTMDLFSEFVHPMIDQILSKKRENQKLTELRDWLLPMLMNGQVKVS